MRGRKIHENMTSEKPVVLITGSGGLIGRAVEERLVGEYDVVGFDRGNGSGPLSGVDRIEVDVTSDESVRDGLRKLKVGHGSRIASVFHLAAFYDFSGEESPMYEKVTVRGTERLLRGLREFEVGQFVFSSTVLVHAPCRLGERITEASPLKPKWAYPESKVQTENLLRSEHGDIPVVILRIGEVYDERCHSLPLSHQMQRVFERQAVNLVFPGDLSHGHSALHLDDLVEVFAMVAERRAQLPAESVFLIGEPETISYGELQDDLQRLLHGGATPTLEIPKPIAKAGAWAMNQLPTGEDPFIKPFMIDIADDQYQMDITRARKLLGWEPRRSLRATLPKMVEALRADPIRWYEENDLDPPETLKEAPTGKEAPVDVEDDEEDVVGSGVSDRSGG